MDMIWPEAYWPMRGRLRSAPPHYRKSGPRGPKPHLPGDPYWLAKYAHIVADRLAKMTMEQIGARHNITRERVRQILVLIGDPSLIGFGADMHKQRRAEREAARWRVCADPICGKRFRAGPYSSGYCRSCSYFHRRSGNIPEQKFRDALAARAQGWTWYRIGTEIFGHSCAANANNGRAATWALRRWAKRVGYDMAWTEGHIRKLPAEERVRRRRESNAEQTAKFMERYHSDPEFRAKYLAKKRARYARLKAAAEPGEKASAAE